MAIAADSKPYFPIDVGSETEIYDATERRAVNATFGDGQPHVMWASGDQITWEFNHGGVYLSPNTARLVICTGTHTDPAASYFESAAYLPLPSGYDYFASGGMMVNPIDGSLFHIAHGERWPGGDPLKFWSALWSCRSRNGGRNWEVLGETCRPGVAYTASPPTGGSNTVEIGSSCLVRCGQWLYFYPRINPTWGGLDSYCSICRAPFDEVMAAAAAGEAYDGWLLWDGSGFNDDPLADLGAPGPGFGAPGDADYFGNHRIHVYYDVEARAYVATCHLPEPVLERRFAFSADAVRWTPFTQVDLGLTRGQNYVAIYPEKVVASDRGYGGFRLLGVKRAGGTAPGDFDWTSMTTTGHAATTPHGGRACGVQGGPAAPFRR